jgi:hypothetical protein
MTLRAERVECSLASKSLGLSYFLNHDHSSSFTQAVRPYLHYIIALSSTIAIEILAMQLIYYSLHLLIFPSSLFSVLRT